mmetsp:Transcript_64232/g.150818  ORF Transcript_64232/g.150818 Transcript_64232/m.150818 type:complete len:652 (-) Transcript_64232:233-2188(-)
MGCCAGTTAGTRKKLPEVSWRCGLSCHCHGLEVEGIPLDRYLDHFTGLGRPEQHEVISRVVESADESATSGARAGVCNRKVARIGFLSWNVGGISDHRKDQGAGLEEEAQAAVADVLQAAVAKIGAADVIVVGLQEVISLTPSNAMKGTSSVNESRRNQTFYGWPETVAQWVELLLGGLNSRPLPAGKSFCSCDHRAYVLYGQPVYLFGLLLCVFCPAYLLKHIRDFGMAEKPMDPRIKSGAKGAVACRFVLWDRSFCFLNCHLAATTSNSARHSIRDLKQRLQQLQQCWTEIKFKSHVNQMVYPVSAHRAIFLLGDTNMRLVNKDSKKDFHAHTLEALGKGSSDLLDLWKLDQLRQEMASSPQPSIQDFHSTGCINVSKEQSFLCQWQEPFVDSNQGPPFPPTFKLAVPGPGYSKKRVPAWTDRVLYSSDHAKPLKYGSVEQSQVLNPPHNVSDHDPVYAFFDVDCIAIHPRRLGALAREVRSAAKDGLRSMYPLAHSPTTQLQAQQQDQAFGNGVLTTHQLEMDDISRKLYEQVSSLGESQSALACLMLQECQEECWKAVCEQLEHKLGCSIRHVASTNSAQHPDLKDEGEEEVIKRLDSEALREGLKEVLNSMQRDRSVSQPVTLLQRRTADSRKSTSNSTSNSLMSL